jgi:hypothetical protein
MSLSVEFGDRGVNGVFKFGGVAEGAASSLAVPKTMI